MINQSIKYVGVVVKPHHAEAWQTACELSEWLEKRNITLIGSPYAQSEVCAIEEVGVEVPRKIGDKPAASEAPVAEPATVPAPAIVPAPIR